MDRPPDKFGQEICPAGIKLKYHETGLKNNNQPNEPSKSTATVVADEINLISHKSNNPLFGSNELKTRLLANETFKARYDAIYAEIERIALNTDFSENFFQTRVSAFNNYNEDHNLIDKDTYSKAVESLKDYLNDKVDEE